MEIRYVPHAIANNFGSYIELNENLKKYPDLHDALLKHELSHTHSQGFTKEDLIIDLTETGVKNKDLIRFMLKHPKSFLQLVPLYKKSGVWIYDINLLIIWSLGLIGGIVAIILALSL